MLASSANTPISIAANSQADNTESPSIMDTSSLIREVSQNFCDMMEVKLFKLSETLDRFSATLESHSKLITEAEQRVSSVEDTLSVLQEKVTKIEKKNKELEASLDEMENRSRRDNIRILNLKEVTEGNQPLQFLESWLPAALCLDGGPGITSRIKIDRAHRGLGPRGSRPRPVIIKLHNPRDKLKILTALRKKPALEHNGQRIYIQQDISAAVRERRRAFNRVCQALISKGIRFNMRYPATLVVYHNESDHKFETKGAAEDFLNSLD